VNFAGPEEVPVGGGGEFLCNLSRFMKIGERLDHLNDSFAPWSLSDCCDITAFSKSALCSDDTVCC
jgi:hypothetical protein